MNINYFKDRGVDSEIASTVASNINIYEGKSPRPPNNIGNVINYVIWHKAKLIESK